MRDSIWQTPVGVCVFSLGTSLSPAGERRFGPVESTRLRSVPINTEDDKGTRRSKSILREYSDDAAVVNGYVVFDTKDGAPPRLRMPSDASQMPRKRSDRNGRCERGTCTAAEAALALNMKEVRECASLAVARALWIGMGRVDHRRGCGLGNSF